jgi:CheY-like chemotaxis protein
VRVCVQVEPTEIDKQVAVKIAVSDSGIGLRQEDQQRIFDSFQQVDASMTRSYGGTGLGLTIVRELVDRMGGSVSLDSVYGKGSCFTVEFRQPIAEAGRLQEPDKKTLLGPVVSVGTEPRLTVKGLMKPSVLLAEDNPTTQELLVILLENAGVNVHVVSNGRQAIDFLERERVDLVFMDCQMPEMDGLEATLQLRRNGLSAPIIALTAHAREEDESRCLVAGMNDFLSKPFRKAELEALLDKWLFSGIASDTPCPQSGLE